MIIHTRLPPLHDAVAVKQVEVDLTKSRGEILEVGQLVETLSLGWEAVAWLSLKQRYPCSSRKLC